MKLKKMRILGQIINIFLKNNLKVVEEDKTTTKCLGCFTSTDNAIYLDTLLKKNYNQCTEVLFHEIIEAITTLLEIELEHPTITTLSTVLYAVLNDNKMLKKINLDDVIVKEDDEAVT